MAVASKTFYKVTWKAGRRQVSIFAPEAAEVVYRARQWTSPKPGCGPLCVFDTLQAALPYQRGMGIYHVWLCKINPSQASAVWNAQDSFPLSLLPKGTVLADGVKLIKRIQV